MTLPNETATPSPQPILRIDEGQIRGHLDVMVRSTVEKTLNDLLDAEAEGLCGAKPHERTEERTGYRSGHYERELETKAGSVTLKVPKLKQEAGASASSIELSRRRYRSMIAVSNRSNHLPGAFRRRLIHHPTPRSRAGGALASNGGAPSKAAATVLTRT